MPIRPAATTERVASEEAAPPIRRDIQGLRAIAVLVVLCNHFHLLWMRGGFVGVDVFFVISGFVIAGVLIRETKTRGRISVLDFYARRVRRIIPASTVSLLVTVLVATALFGRLAVVSLLGDVRAAALFVANLHFAAINTGYFTASAAPSAILNFWSLGVEEQFYVVVPLLFLVVALLRRQPLRTLVPLMGLLVAASFLYSIYATSANPITAYYSPLVRAWELGVGVLLALVLEFWSGPGRWSAWWVATGAAAIGLSVFWFSDATVFPGYAAALPVLGAAALLAGGPATLGDPRFGVLRSPFLTRIGDWSYSIYLWHYPVYILLVERFGALSSVGALVAVACTLALSLLSYYFVEQPARRSEWLRVMTWRTLAIGALTIATLLAVTYVIAPRARAAGKVTNVHPALTALQTEIRASAQVTTLPTVTTPGLAPTLPVTDFSTRYQMAHCTTPATYTTPICHYGPRSAKKLVVLYGNSQAQMWVPAYAWMARHYHFRLDVIAKSACGTFFNEHYLDSYYRTSNLCVRYAHWAATEIRFLHPNVLVIASTSGNVVKTGLTSLSYSANGHLATADYRAVTQAELLTDYTKFVRAVDLPKRNVVLMGSLPKISKWHHVALEPNPCLLENASNITACNVNLAQWTHRWLFPDVAHAAGTAYLPVEPLLCDRTTCPAIVDGVLVRFNSDHLTADYATYVENALAEELQRVQPSVF